MHRAGPRAGLESFIFALRIENLGWTLLAKKYCQLDQ